MKQKRLRILLETVTIAAAFGVLCCATTQAAAAHTDKQAQGKSLFISYCAACHGEKGNGKPASGLKLKPPALDLTAFELSDSFIRRVLQEGVLGTGMAAWKSLPANELSAIASFTATLSRNDSLSPQQRVASDGVLREAGRRVYIVHCARCHGVNGQGDGPEASRYRPPPPSFAEMKPSFAAAARTITEGVPGSAMPAWPRLTRAEIQAVTSYIRSFYRGSSRSAAVSSPAGRHYRLAPP